MVTAAADDLGSPSVLSGKTAFVTGHTGFVGSWLSVLLCQLGANVTGYSLSEDSATATRAEWLKALGVDGTEGDVRDFAGLRSSVEAASPDVIVHLAAQPLVGRGFSAPHMTFDVNINGSLNVLEAARLGSATALVHVTSDKCYAPSAGGREAVTEASALGGESPYSASKTIAEILFKEFSALTGDAMPRMASVRLGNLVGGGDEADRLVPNCLRAFRAGRPFAVRDPDAVRPFQHVLDAAAGVVRLASALLVERVPSGVALNFAPPHSGRTTGEMVSKLAIAWGPAARVSETRDVAIFPEQQILRLDGSKAADLLAWTHALDLATAAAWTVEWVQSVDGGLAPSAVTAEQAARFLSVTGGLP